jgi:hypothetical protein
VVFNVEKPDVPACLVKLLANPLLLLLFLQRDVGSAVDVGSALELACILRGVAAWGMLKGCKG